MSFGHSLKNPTFRGEFIKKRYRGKGLPKKGDHGQFADLRGLGKIEGGV